MLRYKATSKKIKKHIFSFILHAPLILNNFPPYNFITYIFLSDNFFTLLFYAPFHISVFEFCERICTFIFCNFWFTNFFLYNKILQNFYSFSERGSNKVPKRFLILFCLNIFWPELFYDTRISFNIVIGIGESQWE